MWLAPAFHQGPCPFMADAHACSSSSPRCIRRAARVLGRFHWRQIRQRKRRRIQPSSASKMPLTSASRK